MKKRIVFYTVAMNKGGSERVISNLANYFSKKDYNVYIICNLLSKSYYELNKNIKYINLDKKKYNNRISRLIHKVGFIRTLRLDNVLRKINPDLVIAFLPEPSLRITFLNKYKVILSERCDPNKEYSNFIVKLIMKKLFKRAHGFVFQTKDAKNYYKSIITCPSIIIANPLNNNFLGKKYNGKDKTIVTVGRMTEQKNHRMLIKAFSIFAISHPDYILKIYGNGHLLSELKQLTIEYGIEDKVYFMGIVDNLQDVLINDKIFVLSSNFEGMPNALLEAMALGMPCIATDCPVGGPKSLIKNNQNGVLIQVGDIDNLVKKLNDLVDNQILLNKLSNNASKIQNEYKEDKIIKEWEDFCDSIIKIK